MDAKDRKPFSFTEREVYEIISELSPGDLPIGSGLYQPSTFRSFLVKYIVKALQNPDWLLVPKYSDAHKERIKHNLPRPQYLQEDAIDQLRELITDKKEDELLSLAGRVEEGDLQLRHGMEEADIVARALEIMGSEYVNLTMFRGCDFDSQIGYKGVDFAIGDLPTALRFAQMHIGLGRHTGNRIDQVIAMVKVRDVALAYAQGAITISTENTWGRGALEIMVAPESRKIIQLRRPPAIGADSDQVLAIYNKGAIIL